MNELTQRLAYARQDNEKMNRLITDYMPFIISETGRTPVFHVDYDDRLSIAMLVFMNCVHQYKAERGAFLPFAATCIRNRLIDEGKRQQRYQDRVIPIFSDQGPTDAEQELSLNEYDMQREREILSEEIDQLQLALSEYQISFGDLSEVCPRQKRSRELCVRLARETIRDDDMKRYFEEKKRLPQAELAKKFGISVKTLEKHRKYIITLIVILSGDFPGIGSFMPNPGEVKEK